MNTQDALWKAIIEEFFDDFLQFFFTKFYDQVDPCFPFVVLDKELSKIYPETASINRRGDKLIKIRLKDGQEQFILIHVEVQGYKDPDFGRRMYICQYRIDERFNLPVAALVIYTDANKTNRVNQYERICFDTRVLYQFNAFSIADFTEAEYEQMENPFAIICQVALLGIQRNLKDEALFDLKIALFRKLLTKNYTKKRIRLLTNFIKDYVRFSNKEFYRKFDEQADIISNNNEPMGLYETILEIRKQEGKVEGLELGIEHGLELESHISNLEKIIESIKNGFKGNLSIDQISVILDIDKHFITEFSEKKVDAKKLSTQLKKLRKQFKASYSVENLKVDLIKMLFAHQFSANAIYKIINLPLKKVKQIQKALKSKK